MYVSCVCMKENHKRVLLSEILLVSNCFFFMPLQVMFLLCPLKR